MVVPSTGLEISWFRRYGETDFVTALRAVAAVMVISLHTGAFIGLGEIGRRVTSAGTNSVPVFFVIAGFAVAASLHRALIDQSRSPSLARHRRATA